MDPNPFTVARPHGASKGHLKKWCEWGKERGYDHMIVVCDLKKWQDFPVYCYENNYREEYTEQYNLLGQVIREVYDLGMDINNQLQSSRVFNGPKL
jgi:hypothetical protein